jgi:hypothetical protein
MRAGYEARVRKKCCITTTIMLAMEAVKAVGEVCVCV